MESFRLSLAMGFGFLNRDFVASTSQTLKIESILHQETILELIKTLLKPQKMCLATILVFLKPWFRLQSLSP